MLEGLPQPLVRLDGWEEQAQDCFPQTRGFVPDTVMHGCGGATSCSFAYVLEKCLLHLPTGVMRMVESLPHVTRWQSNRSKAFRGNKATSKAYRSVFIMIPRPILYPALFQIVFLRILLIVLVGQANSYQSIIRPSPLSALIADSGYPARENRVVLRIWREVEGSYSVDAGASTSSNLSARHLCLEMLIVSASRSRETNSGRITTVTIIPEHHGIR